MAYKALYRTYRPSTFDEVAGQQHIVKTIKNALATGKIAHAYLFTGPRGTGKTTMAKLLAKALNCDEGIGCQCNECKNCKAIIEGTHPDVLEIDAASNNGVDEVRDLIDKVKYGTILGRYKVYIIDEVHMMSTGAFNALLKTLEEPPEHVIFILATTEPHKILPTILSRCQRYDFTKVSDDDIKERIRVILESEDIVYNDEAVNLIISLADGGMRDALSILDQVLTYSGGRLNVEDILEMFALESTEEKINLIYSILDGNVSDVLTRLSQYIGRGTDIKRLTNDLLMILKDILIYQTTFDTKYLEQLNAEQVVEVANKTKQNNVLKMIEVLMETLKDYKNVTAITPLFEVTLLKLSSMNVIDDNEPVRRMPEPKPFVRQEPVKPVVREAPIELLKREQEKVVPTPKPTVEAKPVEEEVSLFDLSGDTPVTMNKEIIELKGTREDDHFKIDSELMLKVLVNSKKDIKNSMLVEWAKIKKLSTHPTLGKAATLLTDGHLLVASNKIIVVEYPLPNLAEKANMIDIQADLQNVIENIFGKKMFVYALTRVESVNVQQYYTNLAQIGRLPKAENMILEFEGEE